MNYFFPALSVTPTSKCQNDGGHHASVVVYHHGDSLHGDTRMGPFWMCASPGVQPPTVRSACRGRAGARGSDWEQLTDQGRGVWGDEAKCCRGRELGSGPSGCSLQTPLSRTDVTSHIRTNNKAHH